MTVEMKEVTYVELNENEGVWQCDNCGAFELVPGKEFFPTRGLNHHKTCKPGESKRWEKHYEENND